GSGPRSTGNAVMGKTGEWVTFRMPFWRWYVVSVVFGQVMFPLLNLVPAVADPQNFGWAYFRTTSPWGAAVIPAGMAPAMFGSGRLFPIRIRPRGLRGSNAWGLPVTMTWRSIDRVKLFAVPCVPYLRVRSTRTSRSMWLPLFLNDFPHFAELVARHAGRN